MSKIKPFAGFRPRAELVEQIASPPYDVVSRDEARALIAEQPKSFMRVIRPEVELAEGLDPKDPQIYEAGRRNLQALIDEQLLTRDPRPCLYLYEQRMGQHAQVGLVCGTSHAEYAQGLIKKHEKTREKALDGRIRHIEALGANTGLVFLTYHARPEIDAWVDAQRQAAPVYDFVAEDGIGHRFWVVDDDATIAAAQELFARVPALYVADGHHRTEASYQVGERRRQANPDHSGEEPFNYFLAVLFPHDQLQILPYNRFVCDLGGLAPGELRARLAESFEIEPAQRPEPDQPKSFGIYLDGGWSRLTAKPGSYDADDPQASLDVAILQRNLLAPLLGVEDPRADPRIAFVGGIRGAAELERRVAERGGVAFYLYPTAIEQVMAIADAGEVMPPKSTWFEPKLRSGLVVRTIDD